MTLLRYSWYKYQVTNTKYKYIVLAIRRLIVLFVNLTNMPAKCPLECDTMITTVKSFRNIHYCKNGFLTNYFCVGMCFVFNVMVAVRMQRKCYPVTNDNYLIKFDTYGDNLIVRFGRHGYALLSRVIGQIKVHISLFATNSGMPLIVPWNSVTFTVRRIWELVAKSTEVCEERNMRNKCFLLPQSTFIFHTKHYNK